MSTLIGRCHCHSLESCYVYLSLQFLVKNNGQCWFMFYSWKRTMEQVDGKSTLHLELIRDQLGLQLHSTIKKNHAKYEEPTQSDFLGINDFYFPYILIYVYFAKYISHICNSYYHHHHPVRNNNFPNVVIFPCGCLSDVFVPSYTVGCFIYCQISI